MSSAHKNQIEIYSTREGKFPFITWLESLKDKSIRYRIKERLDRVALGNLGDYKVLSEGLVELRLHFGAGYRIYFAWEGSRIIVLLCAGDKSSQKRDIKKAASYWKDYLER